MSIDLRRCRFVEHQPGPVNCVAWCPGPSGLVAVYREGGQLELWRAGEDVKAWVVVGRFLAKAQAGRSVEDIAWAVDGPEARLFTVGLDGFVVEWDLERFIPRRHADTNGGGAGWSLAVSPDQRTLAVGCEAGAVRLFALRSSQGRAVLSHARNLDVQQGGRVLAVAWSPCGQLVGTGSARSSCSLFSVATGRALHVMKLEQLLVPDGRDSKARRETIVWDVAFAADGSFWTADSSGKLCLWAPGTGTLSQTFALSEGDLFSLCSAGGAVYAGGADQRLYELRCAEASRRWFVSGTVRVHSHDVRSITAAADGRVLSGSLDTTMAVFAGAGLARHARLHWYPVASVARLVGAVLWCSEGAALRAWDMAGPAGSAPRQLLHLALSCHIHAFEVDGERVALVTTHGVKVYAYRFVQEAAVVTDVELSELKEHPLPGVPTCVSLAAGQAVRVAVASSKGPAVCHDLVLDGPALVPGAEAASQPCLVVKGMHADGKAAVVIGSDCVHVSSGRAVHTVPVKDVASAVCLPSGNILAVAPTGVCTISARDGSPVDWPKRSKAEIEAALAALPGRIIGAAAAGDRLYLYGSDYILSISLADDSTPEPAGRHSKRAKAAAPKAAGPAEAAAERAAVAATRLTRGYASILFFGFLPDATAVLVERPYADVVAGLPPVMKRKVFGGYN